MSATNVARAGKRGNICVGNNVSSFARALTMELEVRSTTTYSIGGLYLRLMVPREPVRKASLANRTTEG